MATVAGQLVSGSLTGTGTVGPFQPPGNRPFNVFITGTFDAIAEIQKSYDGSTYVTILSQEFNGSAAFSNPVAVVITECDPAILYQVNVTSLTSGQVDVRLG